jgi:hypothetical protein
VWLVPRDDQGYRTTTKVLHWLTVALLAGQLVVGYLLDVDDGGGRGRGRGRGGESGRGRWARASCWSPYSGCCGGG